jgi:hypothetical protein
MESGSPRVVSVRGSGCPTPVARGGAGDVNPWLLCVERRSGGRRTGALGFAHVRKPGTSAAALSLPSFRAPRPGVPFQRNAKAAQRLLRLALAVTLQAANVIADPAAAVCSGSHGRRNGTIAFDGHRSSAGAGRRDRNATNALVSARPAGRSPLRELDRRLVHASAIPADRDAPG